MKLTPSLLCWFFLLQMHSSYAMLAPRLLLAIKNSQRSLCTRISTKTKKFSITPAKVIQKEAVFIPKSEWPKLIPHLSKEHGFFLKTLLKQEKNK